MDLVSVAVGELSGKESYGTVKVEWFPQRISRLFPAPFIGFWYFVENADKPIMQCRAMGECCGNIHLARSISFS
jgi:hypothetical protein